MTAINAEGYYVYFKEDGYKKLAKLINTNTYSKIILFVDENTHNLCLPVFLGKLEVEDYNFEIIEVAPGEQHKNIETCAGVWNALTELNIDRKALIINLGGGVVTDMGGFIASTYKRGIDFINIPTTLLSMVDASVGGKTGIDLGTIKNQVGTIVYPEMVLIDTVFLETLPANQMRSGFAEMLKHGLIQDKNYWKQLTNLTNLSIDDLDSLIYSSVSIKNNVVIEDPREQGLRKILNFGHTLGHAIESFSLENSSDNPLLHGEAIAIGMILEAYISHKQNNMHLSEVDEIKNTIANYFPKVTFTQDEINTILSSLKFDKKNSHGNINFVLLEAIGTPIIDQQVDSQHILEAFNYYFN